MKTLLLLLCALMFGSLAHAGPIVVNFDDLSGDGTVADGYGGIEWNSNWNYYEWAQDPYNPASPSERVYTNYAKWEAGDGHAIPFYFPAPVKFLGADFSGYDSESIHFDLYLGGLLVGSSGTLNPTGLPTFLSSGYAGKVDEVRVVSGDFRVMDNVTYDAAAAPEPSSFVLLGSSFAGLVWMLRRRRS
jgi:hypothetical protein